MQEERTARRCWPLAGKARGPASAAPRRVNTKLSLCIGSEASSDSGTDFVTTSRCPRSTRMADQNVTEETITNKMHPLPMKSKPRQAAHHPRGEAPPERRDVDHHVPRRLGASADRRLDPQDKEVDKKNDARAGIFRRRRRSTVTRPRTRGATESGYGVWTPTSRSPGRSSPPRRSA